MKTNKQLFLISAYQVDKDGIVVEISEPQWVVETSTDRAKVQILQDYLTGNKKDEDWRVKVLQTHHF